MRIHVCTGICATVSCLYFIVSSVTSHGQVPVTHWGRATHICVSKLTIIGSDNGLSPGRRQAITWTNDGILLIGPLGTNFSEILSKIHSLKTSSAKWRPFCLGFHVLTDWSHFADDISKCIFHCCRLSMSAWPVLTAYISIQMNQRHDITIWLHFIKLLEFEFNIGNMYMCDAACKLLTISLKY